MHIAIQGALAGLGAALLLIVLDYLLVRRVAERRALERKQRIELDPTERKRIAATARFAIVFLPPAFAFAAWAFFS
jgi:hypothetical protein